MVSLTLQMFDDSDDKSSCAVSTRKIFLTKLIDVLGAQSRQSSSPYCLLHQAPLTRLGSHKNELHNCKTIHIKRLTFELAHYKPRRLFDVFANTLGNELKWK